MNIIQTPRLLLRTWEALDAPALYALNQDPRVTEFLPGPLTLAQAQAFIAAQQELQSRSGACYFALTLAPAEGEAGHDRAGELAGFAGLKRHESGLPFAPCTDIGWRLAARYWGRGYAGEAARACVRFGFAELGLDEIVSFTVPANLRSRAVMEKLGMREDAGGAFAHPALAADHPLSRHVLYRMRRSDPAAAALMAPPAPSAA